MSSGVLDVTLVANTINYIGYADEKSEITVNGKQARKFMVEAQFLWFVMSLRSL